MVIRGTKTEDVQFLFPRGHTCEAHDDSTEEGPWEVMGRQSQPVHTHVCIWEESGLGQWNVMDFVAGHTIWAPGALQLPLSPSWVPWLVVSEPPTSSIPAEPIPPTEWLETMNGCCFR